MESPCRRSVAPAGDDPGEARSCGDPRGDQPHVPEFLTVEEAADLLRVDRKTIYAEIAARRLDHVRQGRRIIRIPRRAVLESLTRKSR